MFPIFKVLSKCAALGVLGLVFFLVQTDLSVGANRSKKPTTQEIAASDSDIQVRQRMVEWSRQLGVTCVYCHNIENYKSWEKKPMKTASDHVKWVNLLNKEGAYKNSPKVDCFMCHRGTPIPDYKEK